MVKVTKPLITSIMASVLFLPTIASAESNLDYFHENKNKIDVTNKSFVESQKEYVKSFGKHYGKEDSFTTGIEGGELTMSLVDMTPGIVESTSARLEGKDSNELYLEFDGYIQVSDLRSTGEGWHLNVEATPLSEKPKLGGIPPKGGWHVAPSGSILMTKSVFIEPVLALSESEAPTTNLYNLQSEFAIDKGAVTVASAYYGEGMGVWKVMVPVDAMYMKLTKDALKQDNVNYPTSPTPYSTTIKWTLVSGPGN